MPIIQKMVDIKFTCNQLLPKDTGMRNAYNFSSIFIIFYGGDHRDAGIKAKTGKCQ